MKKIYLAWVLAAAITSACSFEASSADSGSRPEMNDPTFQKTRAEIERSPDSALGYVNLAMLYMKEARKTGDFSLNKPAVDAVNHALKIAPSDIPARKLDASLHLSYHRFAEAIEAAEKLKAELPSDSYVYGVLTDAYIEMGDYEKAIASAQQMVNLKPGTASYSRVAQLRVIHGDHTGAVEMFKEAARAADPGDKETQSWCLVQLGDEYWKAGQYADAERSYDEALQNYPDYFLAQVGKGRVRASIGDREGARQLLNAAQARIPNANAILMLGDLYRLEGDESKANEMYERFEAIQAELGVAADHKRLVLNWADRGLTDKALELATSEYAVEKSVYSADGLAWSLYKAGRIDEARKYSREAMRLKTNDAKILFHAGMIASAAGDRREAENLLGKALKLNPAFDLAQAELARQELVRLAAA
jgi:tetratricopeptide (TPR) repeat protein